MANPGKRKQRKVGGFSAPSFGTTASPVAEGSNRDNCLGLSELSPAVVAGEPEQAGSAHDKLRLAARRQFPAGTFLGIAHIP